MDNVFKYRMPSGIAGDVTRIQASIIEAVVASSAHKPIAYGVPIAIDRPSGHARPIGAGDTAASVYGFAVRPYPTQGGAPLRDVLVRGYISVKLNGAAAATKNGAVYVRIANPTPDKPLGGIEAASDETHVKGAPNEKNPKAAGEDKNTFQLTDAHFMGEADANGTVEIAFCV